MSKELEALEQIGAEKLARGELIRNDDKLEPYIGIIKQALQRLESIDNAKPSEALKELELVENWIRDRELESSNVIEPSLNIIKNYIIKTQETEKDKVFLKNLHNTNVKVPLVDIFNGLPREKRFAYTEHIYYHWEEMKESLEAEIKIIKTEKENLELKAQEQKKENELLKEIIKSFFDGGCPLHQYTDEEDVLTIEVDDDCSIMRLGEFKGVDLDKKLKEVLG